MQVKCEPLKAVKRECLCYVIYPYTNVKVVFDHVMVQKFSSSFSKTEFWREF